VLAPIMISSPCIENKGRKMKIAFPQWSPRTLVPAGLISWLMINVGALSAQAFPDSIKDFTPGRNAGFGVEFFPGNALGAPRGTLNAQYPNDRPEDILALGTGGVITFEFSTNRIIDLPGPDFTVFENPVE